MSSTEQPETGQRSPFPALLLGLVLYVLSVAVGSNLVPPIRDAVGDIGRVVFPSLSVGGSAVLISILLFGASAGLFMSIATTGASYIMSHLPRIGKGQAEPEEADAQIPARGSARVPRLMTSGPLGRMIDSMSIEVSGQMVSAGVMGSPTAYVQKYVYYGLVSEILILPLSIFLTLFFSQPLLLALNAAPLVSLLIPRLIVSSKVGDSVREVEEELPYFAIFAAIAQSAGLSLYGAFERIAGAKLFKRMEYEGLLIKRETTFFGTTQTGAIDQRAAEHQSERFQAYLRGYSSVMNSGGDITRYLQDRAKEFLYWTEFRWRSYAQSAGNIGEGMVAVFFTLPLLVLAAAVVAPGATVQILAAMIIIGVPMLSVLGYALITRAQPKTYDDIEGKVLIALLAGLAISVAGYLLSGQVWVGLAGGSLGFALIAGYSALPQVREINKVEDALPAFVRDITEYRKVGYDLTKAVEKLAEERSYNKQFDALLDDISSHLDMSIPLKDAIVKTRSWLAKMVFFMLGQVVETGGGTAELLESVNEFTGRMVSVKKETRANMKLYEMLAYMTPVGLALIIALLFFITQQFSSLSSVSNPLAGLSNLPPFFLDLTRVLVIEVAISLAFLASRTVEFTNYNTTRVAISVGLAVAAILVSAQVEHFIGLTKL